MLKYISGILLMIGAMVGGGILAIPIVSAKFGYLASCLIITLSWLIMTKTGLLILELSLSCPRKYNTFYSIVGTYLGKKIQLIVTFAFLWLLYFSLSSYLSGCVSLIMSYVNVTPSMLNYIIISICFVAIFATLVIAGTNVIFRINSLFVSLKITLLLTIILYVPNTLNLHINQPMSSMFNSGIFSFSLIVINAFGFHFIIPSTISHYNEHQKTIFKRMLIASTSIVFLLYLAWLTTLYSIIPMQGPHGLLSIYTSNNQLLALNTSLTYYLHSALILNIISLFQLVALFGSFICVSLGVFDYLVDMLKLRKRSIIAIYTFTPALILSLLSQNMYVLAMSAAGYIAIFLEIIIPIWAKSKTNSLRQSKIFSKLSHS